MEVGFDDNVYQEEIIPDGHNEVIFYLNNNSKWKSPCNDEWITEPSAFIAGQTLKKHEIKMFAGARLYGIRFYPHTLYPFFKIPLHAINSRILPLSDIMDPEGIWSCITDQPEQTFENMECYLLEMISFQTLNSQGYQYVNRVMNSILKTNGMPGINTIREGGGLSAKYCGDLFRKYVGITPKCLCNILKINQFISNKINYPELSFTELTYESGYYDQSHLIKSFHQFTDTSPRKYFENGHHISNIFSAL